jgi:phosphatidylserine decarboxylase
MVLLLLVLSLLLLFLLVVLANRDPPRKTRFFDGYLSPADGVVVAVRSAEKTVRLKKKIGGVTALLDDFPKAQTIIVIMMKPWHVHTQRAPTDAKVSSLVHRPGRFRNAVHGDWERSTVENEHVSLFLEGKRSCKVYLIAGLLARRIVSLVEEGDSVLQGGKLGKIRLGSQVALVLPKCEVSVKVGDRVYAGLTEVAC